MGTEKQEVEVDQKERLVTSQESTNNERELFSEMIPKIEELATDIIRFGVGGTVFSIDKSALLQCKSSFFAHMVVSESHQLASTGMIMIERNAAHFACVLYYLLNNTFHPPENLTDRFKIAEEFEFFKLSLDCLHL